MKMRGCYIIKNIKCWHLLRHLPSFIYSAVSLSQNCFVLQFKTFYSELSIAKLKIPFRISNQHDILSGKSKPDLEPYPRSRTSHKLFVLGDVVSANTHCFPCLSSVHKSKSICYFVCQVHVNFVYVQLIAPNIWKKKEARNLKKTLIIYNLFEISINGWFTYKLFESGWIAQNRPDLCGEAVNLGRLETNDLVKCSVDHNRIKAFNQLHFQMAPVCALFYLSKFLDLFDSFFLVMSKRLNDISSMKLFYDGYVLLSGDLN